MIDAGPGADPSASTATCSAGSPSLGAIVGAARQADDVRHQLHRADALRRVAGDIGSRLDLDRILSGLSTTRWCCSRPTVGAVFLRSPNGEAVAGVSRGLSQAYLQSVRGFPVRSLPSLAIAAPAAVRRRLQRGSARRGRAGGRRPGGLRHDLHRAVVRWTRRPRPPQRLPRHAPCLDRRRARDDGRPCDPGVGGDQERPELREDGDLGRPARFDPAAGVRLSRLTSDREIGLAIATELRTIIDYHNVRVYRLIGDDLIPVAMRGNIGEYHDETPEQLQVKFGEGITGWVAEHRRRPEPARRREGPRANTIPGTEDDLDESMLLAPMLFEDQVLGVLVLSKLGLHQFSDDDLRLLVIYASFAAQAFSNADATDKLRAQSDALERQLENQRRLLQVTESILTTLDPTRILDQVADHLADLVGYDNIAIEIVDPVSGC